MAKNSLIDAATLRAALVGYEHQKAGLEGKVAEIRRQLGGSARASAAVATSSDSEPRTRRKMGAAARKRIAAAQKKRWAAFHAAKGTPSKRVPSAIKKGAGKRKLTAEGRKRIAEATKRRWAAVRAEKMAAAAAMP